MSSRANPASPDAPFNAAEDRIAYRRQIQSLQALDIISIQRPRDS